MLSPQSSRGSLRCLVTSAAWRRRKEFWRLQWREWWRERAVMEAGIGLRCWRRIVRQAAGLDCPWGDLVDGNFNNIACRYVGFSAVDIVFLQDTFNRAKNWVRELQRQASPNIVIALAGNKVDLEDKRMVEETVRDFLCNFYKLLYSVLYDNFCLKTTEFYAQKIVSLLWQEYVG